MSPTPVEWAVDIEMLTGNPYSLCQILNPISLKSFIYASVISACGHSYYSKTSTQLYDFSLTNVLGLPYSLSVKWTLYLPLCGEDSLAPVPTGLSSPPSKAQ